MTKFQQKVYTVVRCIPAGKVLTYGAVARAIGMPRAARAVGNVLNQNYSSEVPCYRVVRAGGHVGGINRGTPRKVTMLRNEGVVVRGGVIDLNRYIWKKSLK